MRLTRPNSICSLILGCIIGLALAWPVQRSAAQIVANHTVVAKFENIPQAYIDEVKKMWVIVAGESHSAAYRKGAILLGQMYPQFAVSVRESGVPEPYTVEHLRLSRATWGDLNNASGWRYSYGEEDWFVGPGSIARTKNHITYCNTNNLEIAAMGFGWCWDMTGTNWPTGTADPVHQVRWAGRSEYGPDGNRRWGLDEEDALLTGNSISMNTYLNATQEYNDFCTLNGYPTKAFYTTGPVDNNENLNENGYQRFLKHEYIRDFVNNDNKRILFDYGDILCWNDEDDRHEVTWTDYGGTLRTFQAIHPDNMIDLDGTYQEDGDHIGERGAVRLAKAMWWMLARMAGWDGSVVGVNDIDSPMGKVLCPNPVKDYLTLDLEPHHQGGQISLYDLNGKELISQSIDNEQIRLNMKPFDSGIYIVRLLHNGKVEQQKIVKI